MPDTSVPEDRRRVALVADAGSYVGPHLARRLAARDHDLALPMVGTSP